MTNLELARHHGLIVNSLIDDGRWHRVPTEDKPHSSNGAYCVKYGCLTVQNWATDSEAHFYKQNAVASDSVQARAINKQAYEDKLQLQAKAAKKAGYILQNCEMLEHDYLARKGFEKLKWNVYDGKLVIPMRFENKICGVQLIATDGSKKFLFGQRCDMATYVMGNKGLNVLVEGFATGLSVQKILIKASIDCKVYVCFSAGNMVKVAKTLKAGIVIADNDKSNTGLVAAQKIGWPHWISPTVGQDFNDYSATLSEFRLTMELKKLLTHY